MASRFLFPAFALALAGAMGFGVPGAPVVGSTPALAQMGADVELDSGLVEAFIASYPEIKDAAQTIGAEYGLSTDGDATSTWGAWMGATGAWGELNGIVASHGFTDFPQWLQVTMSVAKAYAFAESGDEMDQGMADALDEIRNNPDLSDAQKEMMIQQLQASMSAVASVKPSEANIEAVKPYLAELRTLFE
ncbi:MAG TPA: hypothetical protein VFK86_01785 [Bauldia sp.]|nr:hypothetical protein [Bauldia sp.]